MSLAPVEFLNGRLSRVRHALADASLDALVVTHLPNIFYLTNVSATAGIALVDRESCRLVLDGRYITAVESLLRSGQACPGGRLVRVEETYDETLAGLLKTSGWERVGFEADHTPVSRHAWLQQVLTDAGGDRGAPELVPTRRVIERGRLIKDTFEIATLRQAAALLSEVVDALPALLRVGRTEQELAAEIDYRVRLAGFSRPAFETIVASGPNSALPHARPTERRLGRGDPVVLDFGGVYDGYCVDLTRTLTVGESGPRVRQVGEAVAAAHDAAIAAVAPGRLASDVDRAARETLAGFGLADAFTHGTGHGLGLEIHEEPHVRRRRPAGSVEGGEDAAADARLEPGMVFTIEPGVYLAGQTGARIEDDVLVTSDGCEVLTR
jgi:Xaa-Pro aminopeptidase